MRLSDKLKEIYTSGDTFTVLQLLDKLIKEVEKYETGVTGLYRHKFSIDFNGPHYDVMLINTYPGNDMTIADILEYLESGDQLYNVEFNGTNYVLDVFRKVNDDLKCTAVNLNTGNGTNYTAVSIDSQSVEDI